MAKSGARDMTCSNSVYDSLFLAQTFMYIMLCISMSSIYMIEICFHADVLVGLCGV